MCFSGVARIGVKVGHCENDWGISYFDASGTSMNHMGVRGDVRPQWGVGRSPRKFFNILIDFGLSVEFLDPQIT